MEINFKTLLPTQRLENTNIFSKHAVKKLASYHIITVKDLIDCRDKYGMRAFEVIGDIRFVNEIDDFFQKMDSYVDTFAAIKDFVYSDTNIQNIKIYDMTNVFSPKAMRTMAMCDVNTMKDLVDFCDKYGTNKFLTFNGIGKKTFSEIHDFVEPTKNNLKEVMTILKKFAISSSAKNELQNTEDLPRHKQIQKLKSNIKEYKLAIARMEAELLALESTRKTTTEQKEH